jgi:hypothetical protein
MPIWDWEIANKHLPGCNRAYREQSNILRWLRVHPVYDPVRDDPRFREMLRRTKLGE